MNWQKILDDLNAFAKSNTVASVLIFGIVASALWELIKAIGRHAIISSGRYLSKSQVKNIEFIIAHNRGEIERVERIRNRDVGELYELVEMIYYNLIMTGAIVASYYILQWVIGPVGFYAWLGASCLTAIRIVATTLHFGGLFDKARRFETYRSRKIKRIERQEEVLRRIKSE